MNDQQPRQVFISYVRENREQVDRLCQDLERHGVNVWLDRKSIRPGARWKDAIREAIRRGDFFIACFSDEYTSKAKTYMNEELTLAIEELRKYAYDREWFIPVLLSECDAPARSIGAGETLLDINWVPLYENWEVGIQRILSVIKPISPEIQILISASRSNNVHVRKHAASTLINLGSAAVSALIRALKDEKKSDRLQAAEILGRIGPQAQNAVQALIDTLTDDDKIVRGAAAYALGNIGPEAKSAVAALSKALNDKDKGVRFYAALALVNIGWKEREAVSVIIEALDDKDKDVRRWAVRVLQKIDTPEARKALDEYKKKPIFF